MKNSRFQLSSDAMVLRSLLQEAKIGDTVTYEAMSKAIGRDVRVHAAGAMRTAMKQLLSESRYVFACVTNEGYIRMDDSQIVDSMESDRKKIARAAGRSIKKLECVDYKNLDDAKKREHVAASAQIGAIQMFSKASATKRIASAVKTDTTVLPIGETLRLFS